MSRSTSVLLLEIITGLTILKGTSLDVSVKDDIFGFDAGSEEARPS